MRAIIKGFHSPEINNLENFKPEIADNFCFLLQMMIGPENNLGEESFGFEVCTPKWLMSNYTKDEIILKKT
ncbi:MAG: Imm8 family immunity protein [Chlamydiales bacterium]